MATGRVNLARAMLSTILNGPRVEDDPEGAGLCQLAVCRGQVRTVFMAEPDGDVQPYGYCTACGLPVS
jgi:hypothetical protein